METKFLVTIAAIIVITSMLSAMLSAIAVSSVVTTIVNPSQLIFNLQAELQDLEINCGKEIMSGAIVLELDGEKQYCLIRKKEL